MPQKATELYTDNHEPVNLKLTTADILVVQHSAANLQHTTEEVINGLKRQGVNLFDRLAVPEPDKNIHSELLQNWIKVLQSKHNFREVHVITPRLERSALTSMVESINFTVPGLDEICVHDVEVEQTDKLLKYLVLHCADLRFQENYSRLISNLGIEHFVRLSLAGGSLALNQALARRWLEDSLDPKAGLTDIDEIVIADHIDCAIAGGLVRHDNSELKEALYHLGPLRDVRTFANERRSGRSLNSQLFVVGIGGIINEERLLAFSEEDGDA